MTARLPLCLVLGMFGCFGSHQRGAEAEGSVDASGDRLVVTDSAFTTDASTGTDASAPSCAPDDAREVSCGPSCDGPSEYYWNGDDCLEVGCGQCQGSDCGSGFGSREACLEGHRHCDPAACRLTNGTYRWWQRGCGYRCGVPESDGCTGDFECDCGLGRTFRPGVGCFDDPDCDAWETRPPEYLCEASGGIWGTFCNHSECGERSFDPCVNEACHCPWPKVFDEGRGCVDAAQCFERRSGQSCNGQTRCEGGTICCAGCGIAPPDGDSDCRICMRSACVGGMENGCPADIP